MTSKFDLLTKIHEHVHENLVKYHEKMTSSTNVNRQMLTLSTGDYVYITDETVGSAKKLKNWFKGPYVVHEVQSPHMVFLRDPSNGKVLPQSVHIDRLKMAYVRHPESNNFYQIRTRVPAKTYISQAVQTDTATVVSESSHQDEVTVGDKCSPTLDVPVPNSRPKRQVKKPLRYRDSDHVDPLSLNLGIVENGKGYSNVKRVLAQRFTSEGLQYLVQLEGEPAQNAIRTSASTPNAKTKGKILSNPPPWV